MTSKAMFAGSCIGVVLLVMSLECLRRAGKEYDRYLVDKYTPSLPAEAPAVNSAHSFNHGSKKPASTAEATHGASGTSLSFRPNLMQQAVRALLHMLQFAVAYFVMLLAMYYNGYIIICIFIGAYLGYFVFGWERFKVGNSGNDRMEANATVCCG